MGIITRINDCKYKIKYSYNCIYTQIYTHVYKTVNTHIVVGILNYNYPYKCMFTLI